MTRMAVSASSSDASWASKSALGAQMPGIEALLVGAASRGLAVASSEAATRERGAMASGVGLACAGTSSASRVTRPVVIVAALADGFVEAVFFWAAARIL